MAGSNSVHPTIAGCIHTLDSCIRAVERIPEDVFCQRDDTHESIGAHLRHCIEHVQCFIAGLPEGIVNYDLRERDLTLETCPKTFMNTCRSLIRQLQELQIEDIDAPLNVRQLPAPELDPMDVKSSIARELIFLSSHIIHHISVIQIYCRDANIELPEGINLAFSTAAYRKLVVG